MGNIIPPVTFATSTSHPVAKVATIILMKIRLYWPESLLADLVGHFRLDTIGPDAFPPVLYVTSATRIIDWTKVNFDQYKILKLNLRHLSRRNLYKPIIRNPFPGI